MYIKNNLIIKIYKYSIKIINLLNTYLLPLITIKYLLLSNNILYKYLKWTIRIIVVLSILLGTVYLIYFTLPVLPVLQLPESILNPLNQLLSFYKSLLMPYIESITKLWNDLINLSVEEMIIDQITDTNNLNNTIKAQILLKEGIKEGIKEALDEIFELEENKSNNLKQLALISSVAFFGYFLFYLPNNPESLLQYNLINQSLIEIKIVIKDLLLNFLPSLGGNSGTLPAADASPISPIISPISDTGTVTLNTYLRTMTEVGTQTTLDGTSVSKMVETVNILSDTLPQADAALIQEGVDSIIKTITD